MVAKVIPGSDIDGLVRYNEEKVSEGRAVCLSASGFAADPDQMSTLEKVRRFEKLTGLNAGVEKNALHFILSFPPEEIHGPERMQEIADRYMTLVGYSDQPYLIYQHHDTANPHLHIVTTTIRTDGSAIPDNWFIKKVAAPARQQVEEEFGLIPAKGRGRDQIAEEIDPDAPVIEYGHRETKRVISNVVRMVVGQYKFTSISEFNAVLRQYNVVADEGEVGSLRQQNGGLVYSMLDKYGEKIGRRINASAIHERPTKAVLSTLFEQNVTKRERFRGRLARIVSDAHRNATSLEDFCQQIGQYGVKAHFHKAKDDRVFGLTFIDNLTRVVYKGSDLRKDLGAAPILRRFSPKDRPENGFNTLFIRSVLARTNFDKRPGNIMRAWAKEGLEIRTETDERGKVSYWMGRQDTAANSFLRMPAIVRAWLTASAPQPSKKHPVTKDKGTSAIGRALAKYAGILLRIAWNALARTIPQTIDYTYSASYTPHHFLPKKKKTTKRRQ